MGVRSNLCLDIEPESILELLKELSVKSTGCLLGNDAVYLCTQVPTFLFIYLTTRRHSQRIAV